MPKLYFRSVVYKWNGLVNRFYFCGFYATQKPSIADWPMAIMFYSVLKSKLYASIYNIVI